jgi:hypothetical protein
MSADSIRPDALEPYLAEVLHGHVEVRAVGRPYVADYSNNVIRIMDMGAGTVSTLVGYDIP